MSELDGQDGGRHPDEAAHARQDCFQPSAPMQQTILNALRRDVCGDLAAMMSTMQSQVEENIRDRRNVRKISGCDEEGGPDKARIGNQQSLRTAGSHCRGPGRAGEETHAPSGTEVMARKGRRHPQQRYRRFKTNPDGRKPGKQQEPRAERATEDQTV